MPGENELAVGGSVRTYGFGKRWLQHASVGKVRIIQHETSGRGGGGVRPRLIFEFFWFAETESVHLPTDVSGYAGESKARR